MEEDTARTALRPPSRLDEQGILVLVMMVLVVLELVLTLVLVCGALGSPSAAPAATGLTNV